MSVRYNIALPDLTWDEMDEIMDWLEEYQIHYHPFVIDHFDSQNVDLILDFLNPKDLVWFKLVWS